MLANNHNKYKAETSHVEFVSYTGDWPNACRGVLTLKIDGKEYKFGHKMKSYSLIEGEYKDDNYDSFWESGGHVTLKNGGEVYTNEWIINIDCIPEEFRKYAVEIDYVFNTNVRWGCCGGCI